MRENNLIELGDLVVVNKKTYEIYDFCTKETAEEVLKATEHSAADNIKGYDTLIRDYPDRADYWESCKRKYTDAKYAVMTYKEFLRQQQNYLTSGPIAEITREQYEQALNVLLPYRYCTHNGITMFCFREMYTGSFTTQYAKAGDKYYSAMVDVTDTSTWIAARISKIMDNDIRRTEERESEYEFEQ